MDQKSSAFGSGVLVLVITFMFGCTRERTSEIVRMVERSGAGDIRTASIRSIAKWFDKHQSVALEANRLCGPARASAQAKWPETTEGRVCKAAGEIAGFLEWRRELELNNYHETFQGGSR